MDRSLWLLLGLRLGGFLRHWVRNLRTTKGLLLTLVSSLLFLPWVVLSVFSPRFQLETQVELIRRYGALGLFAFCLLNIILSSEERAIYFAPAEVDFLFPGPFRRRQLLVYRMVGEAFSSLFTALLMTFVFAQHANAFLPAFVGLFLMIELTVLVSLAVGLSISTMGALAFNRRRKLMLLAILGLVGAAFFPLGREALALNAWELLDRLEGSTLVQVVVWPFRPPIMAFTAKRFWPDLAGWTLQGLAIVATLGAAILVLHSEYYEATAVASTKTYARTRAALLGKAASRPLRTGIVLPPLPWWGGIGPNLWRQLLTATRHLDRFVVLVVFLLCPLVPILLFGRGAGSGHSLDLRFTAGVVATMTFTASLIVGFDFRSDIDRMDLLKSLPIPAPSLVISELGVPVLMLSLAQGVCLVTVAAIRGDPTHLVDSLLFLPPFNTLLVETEAILLLWFPFRVVPGATMAFTAVGRQFLLMFTKMIMIGIAAGLVAGIGALIYYLLISSWTVTLAVAWLTLAGFDLALVPLVVVAFNQYDVARDTPP